MSVPDKISFSRRGLLTGASTIAAAGALGLGAGSAPFFYTTQFNHYSSDPCNNAPAG